MKIDLISLSYLPDKELEQLIKEAVLVTDEKGKILDGSIKVRLSYDGGDVVSSLKYWI